MEKIHELEKAIQIVREQGLDGFKKISKAFPRFPESAYLKESNNYKTIIERIHSNSDEEEIWDNYDYYLEVSHNCQVIFNERRNYEGKNDEKLEALFEDISRLN